MLFLLTRLHPGIRNRLRAGADAFERKVWREDLERWDQQVKPEAIKAHRAVQSVALEALDEAALGKHLTVCRDHLARVIYQHHQFTISCMMPVGDLLAHAQAWTGKPAGEIVALLKGWSPIVEGRCRRRTRDARRGDSRGRGSHRAPGSGAAVQEILDGLAERPGAVGEAYRAYIDTVGYRSLSYDVSEPFALELPGVLVRAISASVSGSTRDRGGHAKAESIAQLRVVPRRTRRNSTRCSARRDWSIVFATSEGTIPTAGRSVRAACHSGNGSSARGEKRDR